MQPTCFNYLNGVILASKLFLSLPLSVSTPYPALITPAHMKESESESELQSTDRAHENE